MEPPGTAPGSDPLITSAFMSIVPKDSHNMRPRAVQCNGCGADFFDAISVGYWALFKFARISQSASTNSMPPKIPAFIMGGLSRAIETNRPNAAPP